MVLQNRRELLGKFPDGRPAILAVDGGASKVDVALLTRKGELIGAARHSAYANFGLGHQPPLEALQETIRLACLDGGVDPSSRPLADVGVYCLAGADLPVDEAKLRISIRRLFSLFSLPVAPQAVIHFVQKPAHGHMTDRMSPLLQFASAIVHCWLAAAV